MNEKTWVFESVYTLRQPMSHIGETESSTSFLNTIKILNNGAPAEVFAYTGNAIRGAWRDAGAKYLLDRLQTKVPRKTFHLLFSGGSIGGDQSNDVEQAKALRSALPFLSIFGGGVGNQILAGKMTQTFALPVCAETVKIIPKNIPRIDYDATSTSWRRMTNEAQFIRTDDGKAELGDKYISDQDQARLQGTTSKRKTYNEPPSMQMIYQVEYMIPGVQLWHSLRANCTELELGALVSAIHEWSRNPVLGGMGGKGFGLVDLEMDIVESDGRRTPFILIKDGVQALAEPAQEAKDQYDTHLKRMYDTMLDDGKEKLVGLMEG